MMAGPGCAMTSTATAARPAGASGSNGDDTLPVRRSALVVAVPGDGQARKQAVFAARGTRFLSRGRGAYRLAYESQRHGCVDRIHAQNRQLGQRPPR